MKVLFAVSNESISESIVKQYQKEYKEILSYKNVYYFNAILKEIQKDKTYDRIVISEELEPFASNNYEAIDKFLFEKLDNISDEAQDSNGQETSIIFICTDRRAKGSSFLVKLFSIGVYNALLGNDRVKSEVCKLINKPRIKKEAKMYYKIDAEDAKYNQSNEKEVSELEIQNIRSHFKKLGKNTERYADSFNNIAMQYNDEQLKIIINCLPIEVKAVLEEESPKYQEMMSASGGIRGVRNNAERNREEERRTGIRMDLIDSVSNKIDKPIIIPSSVKKVKPVEKNNTDETSTVNKVIPTPKPVDDDDDDIIDEDDFIEMEKLNRQPEVNPNVVRPTNPVQQNPNVRKVAPTAQVNQSNASKPNVEQSTINRTSANQVNPVNSVNPARPVNQVNPVKPIIKKEETKLPEIEEDDDILPGFNEIPEDEIPIPNFDDIEDDDIPLPNFDNVEDEDITLPNFEDVEDDEITLPNFEDVIEDDDTSLPILEEEDVLPELEEEDTIPEIKTEEEVELPSLNEEIEDNPINAVEKRGRGRPRKIPIDMTPKPKGKRGRPRKVAIGDEAILPGFENEEEKIALPGFDDEIEENTLPGFETEDDILPGIVSEEEEVLPGLEAEEDMLLGLDAEEDILPGIEDEEEVLPELETEEEKILLEFDDEEEILPGIEDVEEEILPGLETEEEKILLEFDDEEEILPGTQNVEEEILPGLETEEDMLPGFETEEDVLPGIEDVEEEILPGLETEDDMLSGFEAEEDVLPGIENVEEEILPGLETEDDMLPGFEAEEDVLPGIEDVEEEILPGLETEDDMLSSFEVEEDVLPGIEDVEEEILPGLETEDDMLSSFEDEEEILPGIENVEEEILPGLETEDDMLSSFEVEEDVLPGIEDVEEEILPGFEDEVAEDEILSGFETEEEVLPGIEDVEEEILPGFEDEVAEDEILSGFETEEEVLPVAEAEEEILPGFEDEVAEDEILSGFETEEEVLPVAEAEEEILPGFEEEVVEEEILQGFEDLDEYTDEVSLPDLDDLDDLNDTDEILPGMEIEPVENEESIIPGLEYNSDPTPTVEETILPGMGFEDENLNNSPVMENNNDFEQYNNAPSQTNAIENVKSKVDYSMSSLNSLLTKEKKIVAFLGTTKNGTSFLINHLGLLFSSLGINTAILDMTKNKNSYYIYTKNEEELRKIAYTSISKLQNGYVEGIKANKNLTIYTALPNDGKDYSNAEPILSTLVQNYSLILIDCDFDTDPSYFASCQELYLVQSMDILTIQPLTALLKDLKVKGVLEPEKIRVVVNKEIKVRGLTSKLIITGMSSYNDPSMSYMTELFNKDAVKHCVIPFDENACSKYMENVAKGTDLTLNGYSKPFIKNLRNLGDMVYPLTSKQTYEKNASPVNQDYSASTFSNSMNNTLSQMRKKY